MADKFPLYEQSLCWDDRGEIPKKRGLLAIFLKEGEEHEQAVPEDWRAKLICNNRLLYIGCSGDLERRFRQHFCGLASSTFRHSIGAMLCVNQKSSASALAKEPCYVDKASTSAWIRKHCTFAYCKHKLGEEGAEKKKEELIMLFKPPLNYIDKRYPHPLLEDARKKCKA